MIAGIVAKATILRLELTTLVASNSKSTMTTVFCATRLLLQLQFMLIIALTHNASASVQRVENHVFPESDYNQTECAVKKCLTITDLIQHHVMSSNMKILFQPGTHNVQDRGVFQVVNVTNFTLSVTDLNKGATIQCNYLTGFRFLSVTNLEISGLTFDRCRWHEYISVKNDISTSSIYIEKSDNVSISNVNVRNGIGTGLYVKSADGLFTVSHSNFSHNDQNFFFLAEDSATENNNASYFTEFNLTVKNSEFSYGKKINNIINNANIYPGMTIKCLQNAYSGFGTINLINITATNNYYSNMYAELHLRLSSLFIENLASSNSENGLTIIVHTHYPQTNIVIKHYVELHTVEVTNATFVNSRIFVDNEDPVSTDSYAPSLGINTAYRLRFTNITVKGRHRRIDGSYFNYNEFKNVRVALQSVTFVETDGLYLQNVHLIIQDYFLYERNHGGVIINRASSNSDIQTRVILYKGKYIFRDNKISDWHNSVLFVVNSVVSMSRYSQLTFKNNSGPISGGILLVNSNFTFFGLGEKIVEFSHNRGRIGGALALFQGSRLKFDCGYANLSFTGNEASEKGGAIYVNDIGYVVQQYLLKTFYSVTRFCRKQPEFYAHFENNTAEIAGSALYGGNLDTYKPPDPFNSLTNSRKHPSLVSSDPLRVCICEGLVPNCNITEMVVEIVPGQTHILSAVAVGQKDGIVPSIVQVLFNNTDRNGISTGALDKIQYTQDVNHECTDLIFTVFSSEERENIILQNSDTIVQVNTMNGPVAWNPGTLSEQLEITFLLRECPLGFYFESDTKRCACHPTLVKQNVQCNLSNSEVLRPLPKWINVTFEHIASGDYYPGVIVHNHCPFHYCIRKLEVAVPLRLETPDKQCAFNRSGILCGACQTHFSHVLGTSRCLECSKPWIALIIPSLALAGAVLVAFLICLNLTVSDGSITGLIFYANIIRANNAVFFPPGVSNSSLGTFTSFLNIFIAWLNLDLGIEACLYDGLTASAKTWFQFLFPLYIWLLVIVIIVASHYSSRAARLSGNNAVQVLATLFLLSYAKLLRLIITIFSSTELVYPDGYTRKVWLYDGNVDYLRGWHIPLYITALVLLVFISLPFTSVLLFIQWLQKWSHVKVLFWVRRLHPLFDAYTGPYKIKHRYWTGLLLLVRVCLFLIFSVNSLGDPTINVLAVVATTFCLLTYISLIGGIYKLWFLNVLENVFLLNLGLLSAAVGFYQSSTTTVVPAITCTSVGISFLLFVAIVFSHAFFRIMKTRKGRALKDLAKTKMFRSKDGGVTQRTHGSDDTLQTLKETLVTESVVEL